MKFIIDIIVVAIVLLCAIIGAKKGFMKIFLTVAAFLVAVYLSYSISPIAAEFVQTKFIAPKVTESIAQSLNDGSEQLKDAVPNIVIKNADKLGFDLDALISSSKDSAEEKLNETANNFVVTYVNPVMIKSISAVAAILLFLILSAVLNVIAKIINKMIKASPAGSFNRFGGALLGCVNGIVFAAAFCLILSAVLSFNSDGFLMFNSETADNSYFYGLFTEFLYK